MEGWFDLVEGWFDLVVEGWFDLLLLLCKISEKLSIGTKRNGNVAIVDFCGNIRLKRSFSAQNDYFCKIPQLCACTLAF